QFLVLDALDDAEDAPADVVVNPGALAGTPDQRNDRERPVGFDVQRVREVLARVAQPLFGGEDLRTGQGLPEVVRDGPNGPRWAAARADRVAHAGAQVG